MGGRWSDLAVRLGTALVMLCVFGLIFFYGGMIFDLTLTVIALVIFDEWRSIEQRPRNSVFWLLLAGLGVLIYSTSSHNIGLASVAEAASIQTFLPWMSLGQWLIFCGFVLVALAWYGGCVVSTLYTFILGVSAVGLSQFAGNDWLFWLGPILLVILTDVGGYVFGRLIGGAKLWPRVSPKKTWSGFLGGLVLSVMMLQGVAFWVRSYPVEMDMVGSASLLAQTPLLLALTSVILSVVSQGGDLFQSHLKRRYGVKDSGQILPGHGGLFDRFDGLAVVIMVMPWLTLFYVRY